MTQPGHELPVHATPVCAQIRPSLCNWNSMPALSANGCGASRFTAASMSMRVRVIELRGSVIDRPVP